MGRAAALAVIALGVGAAPAAASPVELFGFGSRHGAHAGAGVADAEDMAATWMNPAGLAAGAKTLTTGVLGWVSNLRVGERRSPLAQTGGGLFGVTLPAPLGGPLAGRLGLGLAMFVLPTSIVRITARLPDEPFFPFYQGRAERMVIVPGVGVRVTDALDVGVAANFLAGLGGGIEAGEGATRALEARVDEIVPAVARLVAGVRWRARPDLTIAAVYRQRFEVPFTTVARTEVAGEPINLDLAASGQFAPHTAVLGATWKPPGGALHLDAPVLMHISSTRQCRGATRSRRGWVATSRSASAWWAAPATASRPPRCRRRSPASPTCSTGRTTPSGSASRSRGRRRWLASR